MSKKLFTYCILMLGILAKAQISFKTVVDKTQLNMGDRVQVSFVITANDNVDISHVSLPDFKGFQILGRNSGTNISYRNGKVTRQYVETVVLFVKKSGKYIIAPARARIDNKDYESNTVTITVAKNNIQEEEAHINSGAHVSMQMVLSKQEVYPNEPIKAYIKLYAKSYDLLRRRSDIEVPGISGFQVKQISQNQERNFQQEVIDGSVYVSEEIAQYQLTPTQTGSLEIPAFKIRLAIPIDLFDEKIVLLKTTPTMVKVKDLPHPMPSGFSGAIGKFKLNDYLDASKLSINESIHYEVELIGEGNLSSIELPTLSLTKGLELYPPKRRNAFKVSSLGEKGKIVDGYIIVPQRSGKYTIPKMSFTYFDPEKEQYITTSTETRELNIKAELEEEYLLDSQQIAVGDSTADTVSENPVEKINNQVKNLIKIPDLPQYDKDIKPHRYWFLWFLLPVLGILLYFIFKRNKKKKKKVLEKQQILLKDKKQIKSQLKEQLGQLEIAKNHKKVEDFNTISSEILNLVITLFSDTTEHVVYNESQASEILSNKMSDTFIHRWETLHRKNQLMRYSGILPDDSLQDLYVEYENMVKDLINN